jgi:alkylhydroperoxidase family enzyme
LTQDDWKQLKTNDYSKFTPKEQAALRYAEKITKGPTNTASAEADELKKHFSEDQVVDLVCEVALVNLTNRITDGLGLELEMAAEKI